MEIRKIEDYYEKVQEKFPDLSIKQIDTILKFGMRSFYKWNAYGADVYIKGRFITFYIGRFFKDTNRFFEYWLKKSKIKNKILRKMDNKLWDGYYYFGLNDEQFAKYKDDIGDSRRRKQVTFKNIILNKFLEDAKLYNYSHIFRVKIPLDIGNSAAKDEYTTRNFDYILKRNLQTKHYEPVSYE